MTYTEVNMNAYNNFYLPYDKTGKYTSNLITEPQKIKQGANRLIILGYISFFGDSLVITDFTNTTGVILNNTQYSKIEFDAEQTAFTGLEVYKGIIITDPNVGTNLSISYQAVGGVNNPNASILIPLVNSMTAPNKPSNWADIGNKPTLYQPGYHLTDAKNVYGFEYLTSSFNRLLSAIKNSTGIKQAWLSRIVASYQTRVQTFISAYNKNIELGFTPLMTNLYQLTLKLYADTQVLINFRKNMGSTLDTQVAQLKTLTDTANKTALTYEYYYRGYEICAALTKYINVNHGNSN